MMFHFSCGLQDFRLYKVYNLAWIWNVWSTNLLISRFYRIGASFTFSWNFLTLNLGQHHPGTGTIVYFLLLLDFFLCYKTPLPIILLILTETCMQEISMWRERELRLTKNSQGVRKGFLFPLEVETRQAHCEFRLVSLFKNLSSYTV